MLKKEKYTNKEIVLYSKLNKEKDKNAVLTNKLKNLAVQNEILDTIERDKSKKKLEKSWHKNAFNNEKQLLIEYEEVEVRNKRAKDIEPGHRDP
jgi:hypothetical protein